MIWSKRGIGYFMENSGVKIAQEQLEKIVNLKPTRVKLGVGSFITFDFGKDIPEEIKTRNGKKTIYFGEWHLWVYMCAWRIDLSENPFLASHDDREVIQEKLTVLNDKKVLKISVLNDAFDLLMQFEDGYELRLFSVDTIDDDQWLFYTPNRQVFTAGPGSTWSYEPANKA
jgi:hypothetical protein